MVVIIRFNTSMKCKNRITCWEIFVFVLVSTIAVLLSTLRLGAGRKRSGGRQLLLLLKPQSVLLYTPCREVRGL